MDQEHSHAVDGAPLVSVIVPVCDTKPYLPRCLDSLLAQTLERIEVVVIDDGSTDGSGALVDEYAARDGRVRVVHGRRAGAAAARNRGIEIARAPRLMFVDSDDWVEPDFCLHAHQAAEEHRCDLVYFMHRRVFGDGRVETVKAPRPAGLASEADALFVSDHVAVTVWSMLCDQRLFDEVRFPEGRLGEDMGTTHRLVHAARRIWLLDEAPYHYTFGREGSAWNTLSERLVDDSFDMGRLRIDDLEEWGYDVIYQEQLLATFYLVHRGRVGGRGEESHRLARESGPISRELEPALRRMLRLYRACPWLFDCVCKLSGRRLRG